MDIIVIISDQYLDSTKMSFSFRLDFNVLTDPEIGQCDDNGMETDTVDGKY